jgi:hypothetical protein
VTRHPGDAVTRDPECRCGLALELFGREFVARMRAVLRRACSG